VCSRYTPPRWDDLHEVHRSFPPANLSVGPVFPRGKGAFIRRVPVPELDSPELERELVVAQWAPKSRRSKGQASSHLRNGRTTEATLTAETLGRN
jgi:hypothetical protein